jgi:hypothetical protein
MLGDNKNIVMMKNRLNNLKNPPLYFKGVAGKKKRLSDFIIKDQASGKDLKFENIPSNPIA